MIGEYILYAGAMLGSFDNFNEEWQDRIRKEWEFISQYRPVHLNLN